MPESPVLEALFHNAVLANQRKYNTMRGRDFLTLGEVPEWHQLAALGLPNMSLREAVDRYTETIVPRARPRANALHVRNLLYRFIEAVGEDTAINDIDRAKLSVYRNTLVQRGLANTSINRSLDEVGSFLTCCRDNWLLTKEKPRLKRFPEQRRLIYLSKKEERRLLKESSEPLRNLLIFMLGTGARRGEAIDLKWEDVKLARNEKKHTWVVFQITKNGKPHSLPVPHHVTRMLKQIKAQQPRGFPYVFSFRPRRDLRNKNGEFIMKQGVTKRYTRLSSDLLMARARAGLPFMHFHICRHTYATRLIVAGVPLLTVSKLLNHTNIESSLQYVHLSITHLDQSVSVLDR
ncbi:MAG: site-specific integrase [Rhodospirillaceae bacterium]|nr:site-specific integrase [Rhodospirillaceae bacterium]